MKSYSQAAQDIFCLKMLDYKRDGVFVEIGSNDPIFNNNTFLFESEYNWRGMMVEYNPQYLESYKRIRPNSIHVINDATQIDYAKLFKDNNFPENIDFLQIDLEVVNRSTLTTLEIFDKTIFDNHKFGVVCFEHDIYCGDYFSTRRISREIFQKRGYIRVFSDVCHIHNPYEDWYVHPDLVKKDVYEQFITDESMEYSTIIGRILKDVEIKYICK